MIKKMKDDNSKVFNDDYELFHAILKNDERAIKQYHDRIIPPLCGFARKLIGSGEHPEAPLDIAHDAFLKTLQSGYPYTDLSGITFYLYNNVRFKCGDYNRKRKGPQVRPLEDVEDELADKRDLQHDYIRFEYRRLIYEQIKNLPNERDREILLRTLNSEKPVEIAREMGLADDYVRNRLKRLIEVVRNELIKKKMISVVPFFFSLISGL